MPQTCVSRLERGQLEHLRLSTVRRISAALEISLPFEPRWRGGESTRLLDAEHAHLVGRCAAALHGHGWSVELEYTFSVYGERGAVDLVAWHPRERALLIVEVKSTIVDLQDLVSTLDRKVRLVPKLLLAQRGWRAATSAVWSSRLRRRAIAGSLRSTRRHSALPFRHAAARLAAGYTSPMNRCPPSG